MLPRTQDSEVYCNPSESTEVNSVDSDIAASSAVLPLAICIDLELYTEVKIY